MPSSIILYGQNAISHNVRMTLPSTPSYYAASLIILTLINDEREWQTAN